METSDLYAPNAALCQAKLRLDFTLYISLNAVQVGKSGVCHNQLPSKKNLVCFASCHLFRA